MSEIIDSLKKVQVGLIDLSRRNRFINYQTRTSFGVELKIKKPADTYKLLVYDLKKSSIMEYITDTEKDIDKLKKTVRYSKNLLEEIGYNSLFLTIGVFEWKDVEDQDINLSPMIYIPVDITFARNDIFIEFIQEDIFINPSFIQAVSNSYGLDFPKELQEIDEEEMFDINAYYKNLNAFLSDKPIEYKIKRTVGYLDVFNNDSYILYNDLKIENWGSEYLENHELLNKVFSYGFSEKLDDEVDNMSVDDNPKLEKVSNVLDADSSQLRAIYHTIDNKNLLIEGPPGTGKSQTIANIIANNIFMGKKILFVSEKKAALEVVKKRLESVGLGELCLELHSQKVNKKVVIQELYKSYSIRDLVIKRNDDLIQMRSESVHSINHYYKEISKKYNNMSDLLSETIMKFMFLDNAYDYLPNLPLDNINRLNDKEFENKYDFIRKMQVFLNDFGIPKDNPFFGTNNRKINSDIKKVLHEKALKLHVYLNEIIELTSNTPFDVKDVGFEYLYKIRDSIELYRQMKFNDLIINYDFMKNCEEFATFIKDVKDIKIIIENNHFNSKVFSLSDENVKYLKQSVEYYNDNKKFYNKNVMLKKQLELMVSLYYSEKPPKKVKELIDSSVELLKIYDATNFAKQYEFIFYRINCEYKENITEIDLIDLESKIAMVSKINFAVKGLSICTIEEFTNGIVDNNEVLMSLYDKVKDIQTIYELMDKFDNILDYPSKHKTETVKELDEKFKYFNNSMDDIYSYIKYLDLIDLLIEHQMEELVEKIESQDFSGERLEHAFLREKYAYVIEQIYANDSFFSSFNSLVHENDIDTFTKHHKVLLKYNNRETSLEQYIKDVNRMKYKSFATLSQNTQLSFLINEFQKERHRKLRYILSRCYKPIQELKPVFLMSPLSVAKFLEPKQFVFDMVVYDEASQLRPDDVIGTILRAKQMVVVGDSQQLPPTSFFNSVINDEMYNESTINEYESLIKLLKGKGINSVSLDWHYRSEHESLIRFSNNEFYDNKLKYFTSPFQNSPEYGLKYNFVESIYDFGVTRTNVIEAAELVEKVQISIKEYPNQSIGIVALNLAQVDVLADELEQLALKDNGIRDYMIRMQERGEDLFIKNLESVQGDERDIIFISIGYGRYDDFKVSINFGAINRTGGERRLNVLITRARKRCEIFTNMHSFDIPIDEGTSKGVRILKEILYFAENGIGTNEVEDSKKPENDYIANELLKRGYEVDYHVGRDDFYLDLAVKSKTEKDKYLLGIEYDFSLAKNFDNIVDRDVIRPNVLRSKGWLIYRCYSINLYNNKEKIMTEIIDILDREATLEDSLLVKVPDIERPVPKRTVDDKLFKVYEKFNSKNIKCDISNLYELMALIKDIVFYEAPINNEMLNIRLRELGILNEMSKEVKQNIFTALFNLEETSDIAFNDGFYYVVNQPIEFRDRRKCIHVLNGIQDVYSEEIRQGIVRVINESLGINLEGVISLLKYYLECKRFDTNDRYTVERLVNKLVQEHKINIDKNSYYMPNFIR